MNSKIITAGLAIGLLTFLCCGRSEEAEAPRAAANVDLPPLCWADDALRVDPPIIKRCVGVEPVTISWKEPGRAIVRITDAHGVAMTSWPFLSVQGLGEVWRGRA